jgi:hypothetical protein
MVNSKTKLPRSDLKNSKRSYLGNLKNTITKKYGPINRTYTILTNFKLKSNAICPSSTINCNAYILEYKYYAKGQN